MYNSNSYKYYYRYKFYDKQDKYCISDFNSNETQYRYDYYRLFIKYFNNSMYDYVNNIDNQNDAITNEEKHIKEINNKISNIFNKIQISPSSKSVPELTTKNKKNKPKLDLSVPNIFIKGNALNTNSTQTGTNSPLNKNGLNIVDLFLPSFTFKSPEFKNNTETNIEQSVEKLELTEEEKSYEFEILDFKLNNIEDLITLGKKYKVDYINRKKRYNLNLRVLSEMVEPLSELNKMIGMNNIKNAIFDKIILYLQGLDNKNKDYQHIALLGGPGLGKTVVAKQIGKIYAKMGFLSKGHFKEVRLTDLKAGYLGQSELKTQKMLDDSKGCVLFLDEAYSLGSDDKIDSYSQGILDLINLYLDKYKDDFILIIAGYKEDLNNRFFKGNQGLRSRFGLWLELDDYSGNELKNIFIKKVQDYDWSVNNDIITSSFFENNKQYFKYFGRDVEKLFAKCKIAHAKRVLYCDPEFKKIINIDDLEKGLELYKENYSDDTKEIDKEVQFAMYN